MKAISRRKAPQFALDAIDWRILAALQEDASLTNVELAERSASRRRPASSAFALEQTVLT